MTSIFYTYILRNFFFISAGQLVLFRTGGWGRQLDNHLWRIMVPIAKPALVTIGLLNAITCWNSFFYGLCWSQTVQKCAPLCRLAYTLSHDIQRHSL